MTESRAASKHKASASGMVVKKSSSKYVNISARSVHGHASIQESGLLSSAELEYEHKEVTAKVQSSSDYRAYFAKMNATSMDLIWRDVSKLVGKDITASYSSTRGDFVAVMGSSGSGKSTFMNLLAARLKYQLAGKKYDINNTSFKAAKWQSISGCVTFDQQLEAQLTIDQTLMIAVESVPGIQPKQKQERLREVMQKMNLFDPRTKHVADISEGVRRRLIVALELLQRPRLLLLDEPTAGLVHAEALSFNLALKALTESGMCTVVCTVRRVEVDIYDLFDDLIVLKCMFS